MLCSFLNLLSGVLQCVQERFEIPSVAFLESLGYFLVARPLLSSKQARMGVTLPPLSLCTAASKTLQKGSEGLPMNCAFDSVNLHSNSIRFLQLDSCCNCRWDEMHNMGLRSEVLTLFYWPKVYGIVGASDFVKFTLVYLHVLHPFPTCCWFASRHSRWG